MFGLFKKQKKPDSAVLIHFFNTATEKKEEFKPLKQGEVTMYSCGPTVYDHIHIGNLRSYLTADLVKRVLIYNGYRVKHTINFTDFGHLTDDDDGGEDKMMKALKREGKPFTLAAMRELAEVYMDSFVYDNEHFRNLPPTNYTPASDYIKEQIRLIETLVEKGFTYETNDGVYFDVQKFPKYGVLGNVDIAKIKKGVRIETNEEKHHPADFALWKKAMLGWDSAWGKGFPGWHTECAAMAFATLGKQIDIHTGGEDLKYTHHNGEIAEAEAATGKQFVRYWIHNAHLTIDNTKIAKSLGNGIRLASLEDRGYSPEVYRYWLLTSHYRSQVNFTFEALNAAKQALFKLKRHIFEEYKNAKGSVNENYRKNFRTAVNNDLDTPQAVALMWDIVKDTSLSPGDKAATLRDFDAVLAIGLTDKRDDVMRELGVVEIDDIPDDVQILIDEREAARVAQNWDEADRLRVAINMKGYMIEDTPHGLRISKS